MEKFTHYTVEDYIKDNVIPIEPMTAKEPLNNEELEDMLNSEFYYAEEKLDGTRAVIHIREEGNRTFSRRISKKTGWYAENSDNLPHIRDLEVDSRFYGTILDGELRIEGGEFKDIASIMNCLPQEAIKRQEEIGKATFHCFDIIYYRGIYVAKMPLWRRKELLSHIVECLNSPYIKEEFYTDNFLYDDYTKALKDIYLNEKAMLKKKYPNLYECLKDVPLNEDKIKMNKRQWYEYIVFNGGEGLMLKHINGTYKHSRGREYTKVKKFDTWDCVVFGYTQPTKYYEGKGLNDPNYKWLYWIEDESNSTVLKEMTVAEAKAENLVPITKNYYYDWIGTVQLGILMTHKELLDYVKANKKKPMCKAMDGNYSLVYIGECGGFDEGLKQEISYNKDKFLHTVIEVKGQEVAKKTGGIRHPRFIRFREDKDMSQCKWKDHIRG